MRDFKGNPIEIGQRIQSLTTGEVCDVVDIEDEDSYLEATGEDDDGPFLIYASEFYILLSPDDDSV